MTRLPTSTGRALCAALFAIAAGNLTAQVQPQYKVIGPDGSVTYTDRPPVATNARVTPFNRRGEAPAPAPAGADANLPFALRQVATRFPVTLYTSADCPPCDAGRLLLQQRGVPFAERRVAGEDDAAALERAVGGRTVPALTIGAQALRGLSQPDWTAYLDAAGYPRESRLPRSYTGGQPAPSAERASAPARTPGNATPTPLVPDPAPAASGPAQPPPVPEQPASASSIRF